MTQEERDISSSHLVHVELSCLRFITCLLTGAGQVHKYRDTSKHLDFISAIKQWSVGHIDRKMKNSHHICVP